MLDSNGHCMRSERIPSSGWGNRPYSRRDLNPHARRHRSLVCCVFQFRHGCICAMTDSNRSPFTGLNRMPLPVGLMARTYIFDSNNSRNRSIPNLLPNFNSFIVLFYCIILYIRDAVESLPSDSNRDCYCLQGSCHTVRRERQRA